MTLSSAFCASLVLLVQAGLPSLASVSASTTAASQGVTSVTWSAVGNVTGTAPYLAVPTVITWPALNPYQYFFLNNSGTATLTPAGYTISYSITGTVLGLGGNVDLQVCTGGTWNTTTNACTGGTIQTLFSTGGNALTVPAPQPTVPGSALKVRAVLYAISLAAVGNLTINVNRTGAGSTTNS